MSLSEFALRFIENLEYNKNAQSLRLSVVNIEDFPEIVAFYSKALETNTWFGTRMHSKKLQSFFSDALMASEMLWLKLTLGGETVGFSALIQDGDFLCSDETLISTAFQGRGIGTIYFRALCYVARQLQKPIYGDIVYSKHNRIIARVFADEFGLVPIGFVLTRTRQRSPLVMVRIATQESLRDLSRYEQMRLISDAIYKENVRLKGSSKTCVGFNNDTNTPMFLDDQEMISCLLTHKDKTEIRSVSCLLECLKLQVS